MMSRLRLPIATRLGLILYVHLIIFYTLYHEGFYHLLSIANLFLCLLLLFLVFSSDQIQTRFLHFHIFILLRYKKNLFHYFFLLFSSFCFFHSLEITRKFILILQQNFMNTINLDLRVSNIFFDYQLFFTFYILNKNLMLLKLNYES